MTFLELLDGVEVLSHSGDAKVTGLQYDSRKIKPGELFVAMRGELSDGNKFIDRAIGSGAVAIATDSRTETPRPHIAWAQVPHGRRALALLSANFYKHPAGKLAISGITGTNGKSTTAFLLESILKAAQRKTALIGTIEYHVGGEILPAPHTTPESLELNAIFAAALASRATEVVMEVSSHALAQQRVYGVPFDCAVFTNLTRDHLDYHHTMEDYFAAKQILFEGCGTEPPHTTVINVDDEYGRRLIDPSQARGFKTMTYGLAEGDFHAHNINVSLQGTRFELITPDKTIPLFSPLIGRVNVYNIIAASAAAFARSVKPDAISRGVSGLKRVPGRFEPVNCGQPFAVAVDYAHTDDALRNLTSLARELKPDRGRVITVFGCGGDRDRSKRPLMGEAAALHSDLIVLTSDNPRNEDPLAIMNDAVIGLQHANAAYKMEPDRKSAIALAMNEARQDDIVLIAGKGHEKVQITREGSFPFDDVNVVRECLREMGYTCDYDPMDGDA